MTTDEKNIKRITALRLTPKSTKVAQNVKAVNTSTTGYCHEILCPQERHFPNNKR